MRSNASHGMEGESKIKTERLEYVVNPRIKLIPDFSHGIKCFPLGVGEGESKIKSEQLHLIIISQNGKSEERKSRRLEDGKC